MNEFAEWLLRREVDQLAVKEAVTRAKARAELRLAALTGPAEEACSNSPEARSPAIRVHRQHVLRIAADLDVQVQWAPVGSVAERVITLRGADGVARYRARTIVCPPLVSRHAVRVGLHELGHLAPPGPASSVFSEELRAWRFAADHALEWGPDDAAHAVAHVRQLVSAATLLDDAVAAEQLITALQSPSNRREISAQQVAEMCFEMDHGPLTCRGRAGCAARATAYWRHHPTCQSCLERLETDERERHLRTWRRSVGTSKPARDGARPSTSQRCWGLLGSCAAPPTVESDGLPMCDRCADAARVDRALERLRRDRAAPPA